MTRLIAVIKGPSLALSIAQIEQAVKHGADLVEIRLDLLDEGVSLKELPRPLPSLFTLRRKEGEDEPTRLARFEKSLALGPEYCDIEDDTELAFFELVRKKYPKIAIIVSHHDFEKTPAHLDELLGRMLEKGATHVKIAAMANSVNDALHLMIFAKDKKNLTVIAMGIHGQSSRILAGVIGSEFCYAAVNEQEAVDGQLSLEALCKIYRFKSLDTETKIYALLGDPVDKSVGHLFHNKTFPKGAVYIKFRIDSPELPLFFSLMRKFPFKGFSVTMPLKEQLSRFLTRMESPADVIGSVSAIAIEDEHLIGHNTDGVGALNALERHTKVQGKTVVVLGAGGSGRALAYEAMQRKAKVIIVNRTLERAKKLAEEFGCQAEPFEELFKLKYDVLINTIPVDLLIDPESLPPHATVMDIIYWEAETPLLKAAAKRGCTCVGGMEMYEEGAKLQQKLWKIQK